MGIAVEITVSARQRAILEKWTRNVAGTPYRAVERSRLILMSAEGVSNTEQGRRLDIDRQRVAAGGRAGAPRRRTMQHQRPPRDQG